MGHCPQCVTSLWGWKLNLCPWNLSLFICLPTLRQTHLRWDTAMCQMKENIHTSSSSCLPQFLFPFSSLPFYSSSVSSPFSPWGKGFQSRLLSLAHRQCKDQTPAAGQGLWVHSLCQGLPNTYKPPSLLSGPQCPCSPESLKHWQSQHCWDLFLLLPEHSCTTSFGLGNSLDSLGTVST